MSLFGFVCVYKVLLKFVNFYIRGFLIDLYCSGHLYVLCRMQRMTCSSETRHFLSLWPPVAKGRGKKRERDFVPFSNSFWQHHQVSIRRDSLAVKWGNPPLYKGLLY